MKVLIIGPFPLPINGCSLANKVLMDNLVAIPDVSVSFINTSTSEISTKQGESFSLKKAVGFLSKYTEVFKIPKADVVYMTPGQTFFGILKYALFILFCLLFQKPYLIHVHGNYLGTEYERLKSFKKKLFKFFVSNAAGGIVLSESLKLNFKNLLPNNKVYVVKNFVQNELYHAPITEKPTDKLHILYLSNLMQQKGIVELLDALLILKKNGILFTVTIAGSIETSLKNKIEEYFAALANEVNYIGSVSGAAKIGAFVSANVFVLPTYYSMEGQPISLLEALATGNIIVTTKHAGIPDIISEKNGFIVPIKSAKAIADVLIKINGDIDGYLQNMSHSNIAYAKNNFTEQIFCSQILSILKTTYQA
jgi:glycosyltransferase involved in cell wall biosynthesis